MSLHAPRRRQLHALLLSSSLLLGVLLASGQAQVTTTITPDGTLGTAVTQSGTVHDITGGTRPGNGPNLFHSFARFSVGTNDTARFSGPTGIVNILSRVTGGQQSTIDGRLQSTIPGANLYLLNPSGVLFGPSAILDISGSFHVSTADVLRFADGATFSAHIGETSTLTTAPPVAFGFLGPTPAAITVQGSSLGVSEGKAMSVVGGEIHIVGGQLVAPSGRVHIASVASPGEVLASPPEMAPDLQANAFARLGQVTLSQNALLNVNGNAGGTVLIRSGRLLVDQSSILADTVGNANGARKGIDIAVTEDITHRRGGLITAGSVGAGDAGNIQMTARSLHVDGALIGAGTFSGGRAGAVTVEVGTLTLTNGAQIDSSTFGPGQGGTVTVLARDTITLAGQSSQGNPSGVFASAEQDSSGNAGSIRVEAGTLTLTAGAQIISSTFGSGQGGNLTVVARDTISLAGESSQGFPSGLFASAERGSSGNAGSIRVEAGTLTLTAGAQIISSTFGSGQGGNLTVVARDTISLAGESSQGFPSGLFASAERGSSGNAGALRVEAGTLALTAGAQISSNSLGAGRGGTITVTATEAVSLAENARIDASGAGGGTVVIRSGRLLVDQSTITANTFGGVHSAGTGIDLDVRDSIVLTQNAAITAASFGAGDAGAIRIAAHSLRGMDNAFIGAGALGDGKAGDIRIDVGTLTLANRAVIDSSTFGNGAAGHVTIIAPTLELPGGRIRASTEGAGNAGTITVDAGRVSLTEGGQIFSNTSSTGQGGTVTVTASEALRISGQSSAGNASGLFSNSTGSGNAGRVAIVTPVFELVGGQIQATSTDVGKGGAIEVHAGQVILSGAAQLDSSAEGTGRGGTVSVTATDTLSLAENAQIDVHGSGGGTVVIRGSTLLVDHASILADTQGDMHGAEVGVDIQVTGSIVATNSIIGTSSFGAGNAGNVRIAADRVEMKNASFLGSTAGAAGAGGSLEITVGTLQVLDGSQIDSSTFETGKAGAVTITATGAIALSGLDSAGRRSRITSVTAGTGNAGVVSITAPTITMDGALITTGTFDQGRGGDIMLQAGTLMLTRGARIDSSSQGPGQGGGVHIKATDTVTILGRATDGADLAITSDALSIGKAGSVFITTPTLIMDGAVLISSSTTDQGRGGDITVDVGRVTLTGGAHITVSTLGAEQGGTVTVTATDKVVISGRNNHARPGERGSSGLSSFAAGSGDAGQVSVTAPILTMEDDGLISASTFGDGKAGALMIQAGSVSLSGGAAITSITFGAGQGGTVTITARESFSLHNGGGISTSAFDQGNAGRVSISTPSLVMQGSRIETQAESTGGNAGTIVVDADRITLTADAAISSSTRGVGRGGSVSIRGGSLVMDKAFINASTNGDMAGGSIDIRLTNDLDIRNAGAVLAATFGAGRGGDIAVEVGNLTLTGGAEINGTTRGPGPGGNITVTAHNSLSIFGRSSEPFLSLSGLVTNALDAGPAGHIVVATPTLQMDDGVIQALTLGRGSAGEIRINVGSLTLTGGAAISTSTTGAGQGGNVIVTAADLLSISGQDANGVESGITSGTFGSGVGGNIVLQAQRLELNDGGLISVLSLGAGDAGNIVLQAGKTFRSRHGAVTAEAEQADGGNIQLTVGSLVELRDSQITATVKTGVGQGGNITIDPQFVVMQGSQVRADAFGGPGGNVRIVAGVFLADPASIVSASSDLGIDGVVNIQALVTSISGAIAPLPQEFAPIAELLRDRCAGRLREGRVSRLVLGGRDGIPSEPGSLLLSPLMQTAPREDGERTETPARTGQVQERAQYVLAGTLEGLEAECARWTGQKGPTARNNR